MDRCGILRVEVARVLHSTDISMGVLRIRVACSRYLCVSRHIQVSEMIPARLAGESCRPDDVPERSPCQWEDAELDCSSW